MKLEKFRAQAKSQVKQWLFGPQRVTLRSQGPLKRGRVLFSYMHTALHLSDDFLCSATHSNAWESREIARTFVALGYDLDGISWTDMNFLPESQYDVVFDIGSNLQRLAALQDGRPLLLLHLTGSYARFQNSAEIARIEEMERRRGFLYAPKRIVPSVELVDKSLQVADRCSLIGNETTLETYPLAYRDKISRVTVSVANTPFRKDPRRAVVEPRQFLWYFGSGAVHKGLDLVLEVFGTHAEWTLHVVGSVAEETDFLRAYRKELLQSDNIHYHGFLRPDDQEFLRILNKVFAFVAPSCSEGISPAVAACLQLGLYPVISRNTGVTLPDGCGIYIRDLSVSGVEEALEAALVKREGDLRYETAVCQERALSNYSRSQFSANIHEYLRSVLG